MKNFTCMLVALLLLVGLMGALPAAAAGTVSASAGKTSVTIGDTVTVTLKYDGGGKGIGSLDAYFHYNAKTFEYVSCTGATAAGGSGSLKLSYFCQEITAPKNLTVALTFKAIKAGAGDFKLETEGMYDDEDSLLGTPGKTLSVTASNPTLSGDATLSYLKPLKGTLTPKFDKNVTEYTVSVPYTVTRVTLSYTTSDPNATTSIAGKADLSVGKNTRTVTVTAPNGDTKKYTVVITREAQQSTTGSTGTTGTTTTLPPIPEDALDVEVDGKTMVIADIQPSATLPAGFRWDAVTINNVEVPAAKQESTGLTLLYLTEKENDKAGGYYIYDADADTFTPFRSLTTGKVTYVLHDLPNTETGPAGTVPGTLSYEGGSVTAYRYEDPKLADYAIVYVTTPEGESGYYTYDTVEGTLQRYHAATVTVTTPEPPEDDQPVEVKPNENGFVTFVQTYQRIILVCAAACVALAILIVVIVLIARMCSGGGKGKH